MKTQFLSTVAALALLSTSAFALNSTLTLDKQIAGAEGLHTACVDSEVPPADFAAGAITYTLATGVVEDTQVTFKIANAKFKEGEALYLVVGAGGFGVPNNTAVAQMISWEPLAGGDYMSVNMVFNGASGALDPNAPLVLSTDGDGATAHQADDNPTLVFDSGVAAGDVVTIEVVDAQLANGNPAPLLNAPAQEIVEVQTALAAALDPVISYIGVNAFHQRKRFAAHDPAVPMGPLFNRVNSIANLDLDVNDGIDVCQLDTTLLDYTLTVQRDNCDNVVGVTAGGTGLTDNLDCSYTLADTFGTTDPSGDLRIEVDPAGTDVLQPGDWTTNLTVSSPEITSPTPMLTDVASHLWYLNGITFKVPYMHTHPAYATYLIATNESAEDVDVYVDIYADQGAQGGVSQAQRACTYVQLADLPANSTGAYYPTDILAAVDAKCPDFSTTNDRFSATFTVGANRFSSVINAAAFQKDGGNGKRSIPVLTDRPNRWKE